jgi:NADH:ubiquinone oxidoreductase subunit F (NADH-binding)
MGYLLPEDPVVSADDYIARGGGAGLARALNIGEEATLDEVTASGLRGRGGAGFATGRKWASVRSTGRGQRFVVVNGAEGEPATFKDRELIRRDPYRIVEGAAIAAFVVGAGTIYLTTKRSYAREAEALKRAALELSANGMLQDLAIDIVEGPDEYLLGEEKALLEVIEGRDPLPRVLPPYQEGLFAATVASGWEATPVDLQRGATSNPTVVNNAETMASVAHIMANGAEWFRGHGSDESPGNILVTVVGDVRSCAVHEVPLGTRFSEVLERCGGPREGRRFKAALSGVSNPVLPAEAFDTPLTYEDFRAAGSGLGAAGFVVYDDSANMAAVAYEMSRFLSVESCGQCPPCKSGSTTITDLLADVVNGQADATTLASIAAALRTVTDANRCYLGTEEQTLVTSLLNRFPDDFAALLGGRQADLRLVHVPLVKDIRDGVATFDERHARKRGDWTYAPDPRATPG